MWTNLDKLFGAQGLHSEISLKFQLYDLNLKAGQTVSSLVSELKGLMGQLASIGEVVKDKDAIAVLLKAMPKTKDWKPLITHLRFSTVATLETTISTLIEEEKNKGGPSSNSTSSPQAFFTNKKVLKCSFCHKKGHTVDRCFKKDPSKKKCGKCKKQGHLTRECEEFSSKAEGNFVVVTTNPSDHLF